MIPVTSFEGKNIALFGLGGSGLATARALAAGGAHVSVWDDSSTARENAFAEGFFPVDLHEADWSVFSAFVLAPGVPLTHPKPHWSVELAQKAGVAIIGDIELFCRERAIHAPGAPLIAITGTNGKSTTTALIAHILREAGLDVQMGGNIGVPILELEPPAAERVHVVECSTFQIDLAPSLDPSIGLLLNLTPDHLDRHGSMENYAAIKQRVVAAADYAIVGRDDAWCEAIFQGLKQAGRSVVGITNSRPQALASVCCEAGRLRRAFALPALKTLEEVLFDLSRAENLRGAHNGQNAAAAIERWNAAARQYLDADRESLHAGELLLNQRRDLRGLLGALKAKAMANGRAEDPALVELERAANTLLAQRPTPLEPLRRVVADYQERLL